MLRPHLHRSFWLLFALVGTLLLSGPGLVQAQKKPKVDPKDVKKPEEPKKEVPKDKTAPLASIAAHKDWIYTIQLSSDGKSLLTASRDRTVKIWDLGAGKETQVIKDQPSTCKGAVLSPDGKQIAASAGGWDKKKAAWFGQIKIYDAGTGKEVKALNGHTELIQSLAFSKDGKKLASASDDKTAIIWDLATGKELHALKGHTDQVLSVAFNKDGSKVATASRDKTVKVWDTATGKDVQTLKGPERDITSVTFGPDGKIAAASVDETIRIWDADGKDLHKLKTPEGIWSLSFSNDGKYLVGGGWNDTIKVFEVASGKEVAQRNGHTGSVLAVTFLPDGQRFVTAGTDGTIKIWPMAK